MGFEAKAVVGYVRAKVVVERVVGAVFEEVDVELGREVADVDPPVFAFGFGVSVSVSVLGGGGVEEREDEQEEEGGDGRWWHGGFGVGKGIGERGVVCFPFLRGDKEKIEEVGV